MLETVRFQGDVSSTDVPVTRTLRGEYECLPHKASGEMQTLECSFGMKAADGKHYALDLQSMDNSVINTEMGAAIEVGGLLVPIEQISSDIWNKYDIAGIIKVSSFKKI